MWKKNSVVFFIETLLKPWKQMTLTWSHWARPDLKDRRNIKTGVPTPRKREEFPVVEEADWNLTRPVPRGLRSRPQAQEHLGRKNTCPSVKTKSQNWEERVPVSELGPKNCGEAGRSRSCQEEVETFILEVEICQLLTSRLRIQN